MKNFIAIARKCGRYALTLCLNYFFNHKLFFRLIGGMNKKLKIIHSIFTAYPAVEADGLAYMPKILFKKYLWRPFFCNLLWQNGKMILMFVISAGNEHFTPKNLEEMRALEAEMENIRSACNAERKTFAGVLPMKMFSKKIISSVPELETMVLAINKAVVKFRDLPIVFLGKSGFFSQLLAEKLHDMQIAHGKWPEHLQSAVLAINASMNSGLEKMAVFMPRGSVVINEVYGGIKAETLKILEKNACRVYNLAGIKASALLVPMHGQYRNAVPTCASWPAADAEVVLKK
ncbi:MAG: hypothetical protein V1667_01870 [bacterium]